jgi:hypothetical protein
VYCVLQGEIEKCKYGRNRSSLDQGLIEQQDLAQQVDNYQEDLDRTISRVSLECLRSLETNLRYIPKHH